jgi:hypothetical protein
LGTLRFGRNAVRATFTRRDNGQRTRTRLVSVRDRAQLAGARAIKKLRFALAVPAGAAGALVDGIDFIGDISDDYDEPSVRSKWFWGVAGHKPFVTSYRTLSANEAGWPDSRYDRTATEYDATPWGYTRGKTYFVDRDDNRIVVDHYEKTVSIPKSDGKIAEGVYNDSGNKHPTR